ncbi:Cellular retinaldehyde binding/alpha-tocopherol transport,CRAL/TRIO, N-terminal domain,CRAL-TRIO lipid [Cinara cedri]|uniref:Cellular retinaldehyde binding/alpha-tocopherol transport,CRAL/TRIO, N-terminal domain,CRAL-TRIO lipid n=1 Tax=Cinara cedri TaxID=506608 RepID=A0A5E4M6I9_9HEMI|nr:Cellular retinaldehyde binding/alpha-tocopherol transport,CRAL/TRIO, N-terminal domain,CRAL-TRIO lipid [Cinara cedri]
MYLHKRLDETQLEFVTKQDYYRTDEQLDEDVTMLIEWMSKQPHLPEISDRKWLSHFIVGCKYNLRRAKQTMDAYFVSRAEYPELICTFDYEYLKEKMKTGISVVLPKLTPQANRVVIVNIKPIENHVKLDFSLLIKLSISYLDLYVMEEPLRGAVLVLDIKHLPLGQFMNIEPTQIKTFIKMTLNSFPISLKGIHFINPPSFIGQVITFLKMFLPNKIKNRIFVHDTLESLQQFVPKNVLPDQYGGTDGDLDEITQNWFEYFKSKDEFLRNRPMADLSKRVSQTKVNDFGAEGTFKKLEID